MSKRSATTAAVASTTASAESTTSTSAASSTESAKHAKHAKYKYQFCDVSGYGFPWPDCKPASNDLSSYPSPHIEVSDCNFQKIYPESTNNSRAQQSHYSKLYPVPKAEKSANTTTAATTTTTAAATTTTTAAAAKRTTTFSTKSTDASCSLSIASAKFSDDRCRSSKPLQAGAGSKTRTAEANPVANTAPATSSSSSSGPS